MKPIHIWMHHFCRNKRFFTFHFYGSDGGNKQSDNDVFYANVLSLYTWNWHIAGFDQWECWIGANWPITGNKRGIALIFDVHPHSLQCSPSFLITEKFLIPLKSRKNTFLWLLLSLLSPTSLYKTLEATSYRSFKIDT